jgi:hypothetical protein
MRMKRFRDACSDDPRIAKSDTCVALRGLRYSLNALEAHAKAVAWTRKTAYENKHLSKAKKEFFDMSDWRSHRAYDPRDLAAIRAQGAGILREDAGDYGGASLFFAQQLGFCHPIEG